MALIEAWLKSVAIELAVVSTLWPPVAPKTELAVRLAVVVGGASAPSIVFFWRWR